ncbi:hypothetical protein MPSEU_000846900 [Mayamaea pseudoterrestris]|nr:hypothetical protein MPSEU_000846900 [Mayamaea pseudoterrestris]
MIWKPTIATFLLASTCGGDSTHASELSSLIPRFLQELWPIRFAAHKPPTLIPEKKDISFQANDATSLTMETFDFFVANHRAVFINYCSSKTGICHHVAPEWEQFSDIAPHIFSHVGVAKVDCAQEPILCKSKHVKNYPTLRWYDERQVQNYHGVLSAKHFVQIVARNMNQTASFSNDEDGLPMVSVA